MISVIIITKNEVHHLRECLESVSWADEIIVLDSGSTDGSQEICRNFNCQLIETDWPGFGIQKNRALSYASNDWVLSIDADERVSDSLKKEILSTLENPLHMGYYMPRRSSYCGQFIEHSGWSPDFILRLFKRQNSRFTDDLVHEKAIVDGSTGKLSEILIHYSFRTLDQVLDKVNLYSTLGAQKLYKQGKRSSLSKAIFKGLWSFFRTYILQLGILDGSKGLMLAISNAEGTYYKYAKLSLLNMSENNADNS
ncbi:MAG: glycosyltransferase family 2 protein [Oceanospirillaceae bacterium]|nr:glycosyltransferase family 2 protein [Oceanospirillaceae bacterium]